jgi:hypothetical protein
MESSKSYMNLSVSEFIKEMTRKYDFPNLNATPCEQSAGKKIPAKSKKRTYEETFGSREYDNARYGQEIDETFFQTNVGHAVIG